MADPFEFGPSSAQRRRTAQVAVALLASVLVVAMAVAVPLAVQRERDSQVPVGAADLDEVMVYDEIEGGHTGGDVDYEQVPPVGGPHNPAWLECGAYDSPVPDENAVHDLEHGTVWITYEPGLPADQVDALADLLPQNGLISPYEDLPAPVVVTVWARQLELDGPDDPRLPLFLAEYGDGHTAPEPFASCTGGLNEADLTADV